MDWIVEIKQTAVKQLKKLDKTWRTKILDYLENDVIPSGDPRSKGKILTGDKKGLWRYRVGDYRVICDILDNKLVVLVLTVGHRKEVY